MRPGYLSRAIRDRVSQHVVDHLTRDAFEASVFEQTWEHADTGARTLFAVLAFPEDAEVAGSFRLARMGGDTSRLWLVENRLRDVSTEFKKSIVATEGPDEAQLRRDTWARYRP